MTGDKGYREVKPDGTRVYQCYREYKPKALEDRLIGINKPTDPRAVRFYGKWFIPLDLLPEEDRALPETVPDSECLKHKMYCNCQACRRPHAASLLKQRAAGTLKDWALRGD